jgi:heterotetrameric sarcosine oxidase delta subunit
MLQIKCPWCGKRDEEEFTPGGQAHIERPEDPSKLSDEEWADYLFTRDNPRGVQLEKWRHTFGCRQWFNIARHTVTHEITAIYPIDGVYHGDKNTEKSTISKKGE